LTSASTLVLIIANLFPIAGTIFLGWNLSDVMVLYWAESAVIGIFNLFKIIVIGRWMALLVGPFFLGHFSAFMAIHFLFIYTIFVKGGQGMGASGGDLADVAQLFVNLCFMQLVLILGGGISMILGQTEPVLIAVIGLKIYFDVKAHIKEHAGGQGGGNGSEMA